MSYNTKEKTEVNQKTTSKKFVRHDKTLVLGDNALSSVRGALGNNL